MHKKMLNDAKPEQLKSFLSDQLDELKRTMPELYEQMECELYEHIYGPHFTSWKYDEAVSDLKNEDGTVGPHWTAEQITEYAKAHGLQYRGYNEYDFAYVMNMVYSDYRGAVQDSTDAYFMLARAFIEDNDAPEGKAFLYWKAMRG